MSNDSAFAILQSSVTLLFEVALPLLLVGLVVGVAISLVQAATQVQEASLVFVPKLIAIAATFWISAPWMGDKLISFVREVFTAMSMVGANGGM
ncbi:MAG: flagellar biosynthetic protein FliQ [Myxococcota bacterium]|jgi:flagellar biosynthetic protein FliQ